MVITNFKNITLALSVIATLGMSAQAKVLFTEDFEDDLNPNGWSFGTVGGGTLSLNGQATANDNLYTIGTGATALTLEADITWDPSGAPWFYMGLNDGVAAADGSSSLGTFGGSGANGWRYRDGDTAASTYDTTLHPEAGSRTDHFMVQYTLSEGAVTMTTFMNGSAVGLVSYDTLDTSFAGIDGVYLRAGSGSAVFDNVVVSDNIGDTVLLAITNIQYSPEADTISLTWASSPGVSYAVKYTTNLAGNWDSEVDDNVEGAEGNETTFEFVLTDAGIIDARKVFFRIEEGYPPPGFSHNSHHRSLFSRQLVRELRIGRGNSDKNIHPLTAENWFCDFSLFFTKKLHLT